MWNIIVTLIGVLTAPIRRRLFARRHRKAVQHHVRRGKADDLERAQQIDRLASQRIERDL